jgi:hypothetical protein
MRATLLRRWHEYQQLCLISRVIVQVESLIGTCPISAFTRQWVQLASEKPCYQQLLGLTGPNSVSKTLCRSFKRKEEPSHRKSSSRKCSVSIFPVW